MIEAELHVIGGKHSGQVIPLNRRKFLIGRESDCQLRPNSELVSRHHCVFAVDEYAVRLRDLGSTNGTTVNGQRIVKEATLVAGDRVVVGNLEFEFRVASPSTRTGDETVVSSTETVMEISAAQQQPSEENTDGGAPPPTASQPADAPPTPPAGTETITQMPALNSPAPGMGDTTVIAQGPMVPGQAPYQPMMPQQMGFPGQMYGGYPYQPQPQMPMYPQGFPQQPVMPGQMPGFPQQPAPAPAPTAAAPAAPVEAPQEDDNFDMNVSLPDPAETGAKEAAAPKAEEGQKKETKKDDEKSNSAAADIIRQYTQRRPGA